MRKVSTSNFRSPNSYERFTTIAYRNISRMNKFLVQRL